MIKASIPARKEILGCGSAAEEEEVRERGLCSYEEIMVGGVESEKTRLRLECKTIFGWNEAISPHLAVQREGMEVDDSMLRGMVEKCLEQCIRDEGNASKEGVWRVIETAGGVASPGPSGTLQCDLFRHALHINLIFFFFFAGAKKSSLPGSVLGFSPLS